MQQRRCLLLIALLARSYHAASTNFSLSYDPLAAPVNDVNALWAASPMTDHGLQSNSTSRWLVPSTVFSASQAGVALAWSASKNVTYPFVSSLSLVRLLGGWLQDPASSAPPEWSDVVYRLANGSLAWRWDALWDRMDPAIRAAGLYPTIVLDNVPYALAAGGGEVSVYGQVLGPANTTEYTLFIETLTAGIADRYGSATAASWLWRVGTEPNTRPGHWNSTNEAWVAMYIAAATGVRRVLPTARIGPGNFCPCPGTLESDIFSIIDGIVGAGAPIDFLAASLYGSASHRLEGYEPSVAGGIVATLAALRERHPANLGGVPLYVMEYGTLDNEVKMVSGEPGAFGAAWRLASTSVAAALGASEFFSWNALEWGLGRGEDVAFQSSMLLQAIVGTAAGGAGSAALVTASGSAAFCRTETELPNGVCLAPRKSNATGALQVAGMAVIAGSPPPGSMPLLRLGQLGPAPNGTLLMLVAALSADRYTKNSVGVSISFQCPDAWGAACDAPSAAPSCLSLVISESALMHDGILAEAVRNGTNSTPAGLVNGITDMLTPAGLANVRGNTARWLGVLVSSAAPVEAAAAGVAVACDSSTKACSASATLETPSVLALWCLPGGAHGASARSRVSKTPRATNS